MNRRLARPRHGRGRQRGRWRRSGPVYFGARRITGGLCCLRVSSVVVHRVTEPRMLRPLTVCLVALSVLGAGRADLLEGGAGRGGQAPAPSATPRPRGRDHHRRSPVGVGPGQRFRPGRTHHRRPGVGAVRHQSRRSASSTNASSLRTAPSSRDGWRCCSNGSMPASSSAITPTPIPISTRLRSRRMRPM